MHAQQNSRIKCLSKLSCITDLHFAAARGCARHLPLTNDFWPRENSQYDQAWPGVKANKSCPICLTDYPTERDTCPTDGALLIASSEWAPGALIRNKYRILGRIGRGAMGTVYKAEHIALEEVRALKVMSPQLASDLEFVQRFQQEARAARRLQHRNIVRVDDLDQAEDGGLFIAMEHVDGVTLCQLLQAVDGPLPLGRAFRIVRGIAEGLEVAHSFGIVHRDIKPDNILMARGPEDTDLPKLADFGHSDVRSARAMEEIAGSRAGRSDRPLRSRSDLLSNADRTVAIRRQRTRTMDVRPPQLRASAPEPMQLCVVAIGGHGRARPKTSMQESRRPFSRCPNIPERTHRARGPSARVRSLGVFGPAGGLGSR